MNLNKTFSWHYASTLVNTITNLIHSHTHVYCTMKGRENLHVNFYPNDFHCLLCKIVWSYQGQMAHTTMWTIRVQNTSRPLANFRTINQNDHAKCYVVSLFVWTMNLGCEQCGYSLYHAHLSTCVEKEMVHATTPAHFPTLLLPHSRELLNHEPHTKHHNCLQGYWYLEGCWGQPGAMGNMSIGERTLNLKSPVQKP